MRRYSFHRIAVAVVIAVLLIAATGHPFAGLGMADAAAVRGDVPTFAAAPAYQLEGFTWPRRASVAVYYTWEGGPCLIDGTDLSGPASALVSAAVAQQALQSSLDDINSQLRGGLMLVNAGPASRADLCSQNTARPIVVGFGNIGPVGPSSETGLAISFGLTSSSTPGVATYQAARVFLSDNYAFACTGTPTYRDLQHTVTHELLHAIGVGHSLDQTAIMAPSSVACQSSYLLQPDDIAALAALYPPPAPGAGFVGTAPAASSIGLLVTAGVTNPVALVTSLGTAGCLVQSLALLVNGNWLIYLNGAPAVVNGAFPASLAASTPFFVRCK